MLYWEKDLQGDIRTKLLTYETEAWRLAPNWGRACPLGASPSWGQALGLMIFEDGWGFGCQHSEVLTQLMTTCLTLTGSILLGNDPQHYLHNRVTHCYTKSGDCLLASYQQSSVQGGFLSHAVCLLAVLWPPPPWKYITKLIQAISEPPKRNSTFKKFQTIWNLLKLFWTIYAIFQPFSVPELESAG